MSYYGGPGQNGAPAGANQLVRAVAPQLFGQLQFSQSGQNNPLGFPDQASHLQLLQQQQHQQSNFQNLNVNFLTEQLAAAGVGQMISQAASASNQNSQQNMPSISMQSLMTPMSLTTLSFPSIQVPQSSSIQQQSNTTGQKPRVFTGTVTKTHDNFGFIDDEVFFQTGAVKGPILPKPGDRVYVEAEYNASSPFKWNASRVQIVNMGGSTLSSKSQSPQPGSHNFQSTQNQNHEKLQQNRSQGSQGHLVAPPPPNISLQTSSQSSRANTSVSSSSSNYSQVSIISNPHSIYSHSQGPNMSGQANVNMSMSANNAGMPIPAFQQQQRVMNRGRPISNPGMMPMPMPVPMPVMDPSIGMAMPMQCAPYGNNPQIPSLFQNEVNSNSKTLDMETFRPDLDRKDQRDQRDRGSGSGNRERENRGKERERERDRTRSRSRERERPRVIERERSRERERPRRRSRSPTPKKARTEQWRERNEKRNERAILEGRKDKDGDRPARNPSPASSSTSRRRSRSRDRDADKDKDVSKSSRRGASKDKDKEKVTSTRARSRSISPIRKTSRYSVTVPAYSFDLLELGVSELKRRYPRLYIPSDLFMVKACWLESFPLDKPLDLTRPSPIHVFRKPTDRVDLGTLQYDPETKRQIVKAEPAVPEPEDTSKIFTAKVILMSTPTGLYRSAGCTGEAPTDGDESNKALPRLLNFVMAIKAGKTELMAIGGPWSASVDGPNPQSDPQVLINTAIRTCKVMSGIDLSKCTKWYRFIELYYRRSNGILETVVIFLPDLSTILPTTKEWKDVTAAYRLAIVGPEIVKKEKPAPASKSVKPKKEVEQPPPAEESKKATEAEAAEEMETEEEEQDSTTVKQELESPVKIQDSIEPTPEPTDDLNEDQVSKDNEVAPIEIDATEPAEDAVGVNGGTHFTLLEPKNMNVAKLREELSLRGLNSKGLKNQLTVRLQKALKDEEEKETDEAVQLEETIETDQEVVTENEISENGVGVGEEMDTELPAEEEDKPDSADDTLVDTAIGEVVDEVEGDDENEETEPEVVKIEVECDTEVAIPIRSDILVPVLPPGMNEKDKKVWERRYAVPKKPYILAHPPPTTDCAKMCLSSLREYRLSDMKESSSEVSLFAEFFHEMLQRDFAFRIYCEALRRSQISTSSSSSKSQDEVKTKDDSSKEETKSSDTKKRGGERKASNASSQSTEAQKATDSAKVINAPLQLAFTYFDVNKSGYIKETDLEDLCHVTGLGLNRAQIRKVLQKIYEKTSNFYYNNWTDKPIEAGKRSSSDETNFAAELVHKGNKSLLPVFFHSSTNEAGKDNEETNAELRTNMDTEDELEKYKRERLELEANLNVVTNTLNESKIQVTELKRSSENWKSEYTKLKEQFKANEITAKSNQNDLETLRRSTERFYERVKDLIRVPSSKDKDKEKDKEKDTN